MATARAEAIAGPDPKVRDRTNAMLRFALGVTGAFVLSEAMGWYPSFLGAILAAVLLVSLPGPLSFKAGLVLILVQLLAATGAYALTSLLLGVPIVLFGAIALILFLSFSVMVQGRAVFPLLLLLIAISTIPVVTMVTPEHAGALPKAFVRGMAVAVVSLWVVHALWPQIVKGAGPPASAPIASPMRHALIGTAIVMPIMLVYLMFGLTDALPVLITTVVLVVNFDPKRGYAQGMAMMFGNFIGGIIALLSYAFLQISPSLLTLTLIVLLVAFFFAGWLARAGSGAPVVLVTSNQAIILLSLALMPGPSNSGIWATRLLQLGIACAFAVAMMTLFLPRTQKVPAVGETAGTE